MTRKEYTAEIARLAVMLRQRPMTARAIAKALRCSKPVAHERLKALQKAHTVVTRKVRESPTGPLAIAYRLTR